MTIPSPDQLAANSVFLRRVAERLLASPDLADDAVQETLLVSLKRPAPPTVGMRAWLTGVLKNVARNVRRGEGRRAEHEGRATAREPTSPEAIRAREETRRRLIEAVLTLPEPLREVILLRYDEGLPPREVAERTGAPVSTVHDRLRQAVIALRGRLELEPGDATPEGARGAERRRLALAAFAGSLPTAASGALAVGGIVMGKKIALGIAALLLAAGAVTYALMPRTERSASAPSSETALSAASPGSKAREGPELEGSRRTRPLLDKSAKGTSLLLGRVISGKTEAPVAGARVLAFAFEGLRLLPEQTTDASGAFAFPETKGRTGAFHLVVRHPEFAPHVEAATETLAKGREVRLRGPSWIVGRLEPTDGEPGPVRGRVRALTRGGLRADGLPRMLGLDLGQIVPHDLQSDAEAGVEADGRFELGPLGAETYSVAYLTDGRPPFEIGGARSYDETTGIVLRHDQTVDLGTITLPAARRTVIRVLDAETERPVTDARFEAVHEMDGRTVTMPLVASPSGAPGDYVIEGWQDAAALELGRVRVSAPGYGPGIAAFFADHEEGPPVARLGRVARVEGEVRANDGGPLAGMLVFARLDVNGAVLAATSSDGAGRFALEGLPVSQELSVVAADRSARSVHAVAPVTLEPGETLRVVLGGTDETGVEGVFHHAKGPIEEALVTLDTPDGRRVQIQTGTDGRFAFVGLRPGRHELAAWVPVSNEYVKRVVDVTEGQTADASIRLRHPLTGRIEVHSLAGDRMETGAVTNDLAVQARPVEPKGAPQVRVPVQADGTFSLLLPDATSWTLSVDGKNAVVLEPPTVEMPRPSGAPPVTLLVTLDPQDGTIALTVKDAESGTLLPEATYHGRHRTWTSRGTLSHDATVRLSQATIGRYEYVVEENEHVAVLVAFDLTSTLRSVVRDVRLPRANGVRVTGFSGPANARTAGLEVGDVIVRHGDARVENLRALRAAIEATKPADTVRVEVLRRDASVAVTLAGGRLGITAENVRVEAR